ncbi:MAG: hypothetical protein IKM61_02435 [Eubacteriaceae bacterium]|nr:hypothetical protein [Eubacteriaceae bacterium]
MSKKYSDEVIYLSKATGISKYRCRAVLRECGNDINEAFVILNKISSDKYEKALDNISSFARGEKGSVVSVNEGKENIFRMPSLVLILFLIVLDVPSWVISVILLLFMIFGVEVTMSLADKGEKEHIRTVNRDEYKKQKKIEEKITGKGTKKDEDGYVEITIEE